MLNQDEKRYLRELVKRELERFRQEKKMLFIDMPLPFLKGEHEYVHFIEGILKKLE